MVLLLPMLVYFAWFLSELRPFYHVSLDIKASQLVVTKWGRLRHRDLFLVKKYPTQFEYKNDDYALKFIIDTQSDKLWPNLHVGLFGDGYTFKSSIMGCAGVSYKTPVKNLVNSDDLVSFEAFAPYKGNCMDLIEKEKSRTLTIDIYKDNQFLNRHEISYYYKENGFRDNRVWP